MTRTSHVFVVDDDPSARHGLARLLRAAGHDVRQYATAADFLDALDPGASGCVVLDIRMPGLSSEEMYTELKARGVHLPIIVVTADDDPGTRKKAHDIDAAGFFRKPVDGTALLDAVEWVLRKKNGTGGNPKPQNGE